MPLKGASRPSAGAAAAPGQEGAQPSPEQLMALLEEMQRQGHDLDEISPDLSALMRNVKREKGQPTDDMPTEEITPEPGFVIKTQDTSSGEKVFINVCASDKVPAPGSGWANGKIPEEVQAALENRDGGSDANMEALRFPLSCGRVRQELDKKGQPCIGIDCILHSDVVKQTAGSRLLKAFLVELCLGWVAHKTGRTLDPKFKLPKMRYKGDTIETQNIRVDRKPLVCEVKDLPDEPSFPLVTKKPKQPLQQPANATPSGSAGLAAGQASEGRAGGAAEAGGAAVGPSGRVASELKPSAIYPASQPAARQSLQHTVTYIGQPAEEVMVTVQVPGAGPGSQVGVDPAAPVALPLVELSGRWVHVTCPGCEELKVQLPLAVTHAGGSRAEFDARQGQLVLRLRYLPLRQYIDQMRTEKPLAFGQLGLGTDGLLDLE